MITNKSQGLDKDKDIVLNYLEVKWKSVDPMTMFELIACKELFEKNSIFIEQNKDIKKNTFLAQVWNIPHIVLSYNN